MSLNGKVAIVTGGTKGIGAAIVKKFQELGATLVVTYSSDEQSAKQTKELLGSDHLVLKSDSSKEEDIHELVDETVRKFSKIDIIVHNAGIMINNNPSDITARDIDLSYQINVRGPILLTQYAVPHIPKGGRIVFLSSSLCGLSTVLPHYAPYIMSKGAIEQYARAAARELFTQGINVNIISPGPTSTDLFMKNNSEQAIAMISGLTPGKRLGAPEDIANAISLLTLPESSWVNGQNIRVNGGFVV